MIIVKRCQNMYLFFTICGFLFVTISSIIINYIYDIFPINKITIFLKPLGKNFFNQINITIIPILLWSYIELPMLVTNKYFFLSILLNSFVSCIIIYIIKNSSYLINKKTENTIDSIAIIFATLFGQLIQYLILLIGTNSLKNAILQMIFLILYSVLIIVLRINPIKKNR